MKPASLQFAAVLAIVSIASTSCQNLTPAENAGVFGTGSAIAAGAIARASGMSTAQSLATGAAVGAVVAATTYVIAKHQATQRQRQVAEQRARLAHARMIAQRRAEERQAPAARKKPVRRVPRYIAVDTIKDERSAPRTKKAVMIWDTQSQQIVGNNVYDIETPPPVGSTTKFETYSAEYVGASL